MIAIACDHAALEMKAEVIRILEERGLEYTDFGTYTADSCHYPIFGARAAQAVADGRFVIHETETVIYAASVSADAASYGLTDKTLPGYFRLIRQDWNSGEM